MRYTYEVYDINAKRQDIHVRAEAVQWKPDTDKVVIFDNMHPEDDSVVITSKDDWEEWCDGQARQQQWRDRHDPQEAFFKEEDGFMLKKVNNLNTVMETGKKDYVNPSHYQAYFLDVMTGKELQWMEAKQYEVKFRDPARFKTALLLQADKYLSRLGQKDDEVQEIKKAIWYLKFLAAYMANGNKPIRVEEIDKLLGKI